MAGELVATILYRSGGAALRVRRGGGGWATTDPRPRTRPAAHSLRQLDTPLNISNMFVPWSRAPALRIHCTTETPSPPAAGPVWYCTRQPPPNLRLTHEAWHPPTRHQVQRLDFSASLIMCVGDTPCFDAGEGSREEVGAPTICSSPLALPHAGGRWVSGSSRSLTRAVTFSETDVATRLATRSATRDATRSAIEVASCASCGLTLAITRAATFSLSSLADGSTSSIDEALGAGCAGARVDEPVMLTAGFGASHRAGRAGAAAGGGGAAAAGGGGAAAAGGGAASGSDGAQRDGRAGGGSSRADGGVGAGQSGAAPCDVDGCGGAHRPGREREAPAEEGAVGGSAPAGAPAGSSFWTVLAVEGSASAASTSMSSPSKSSTII